MKNFWPKWMRSRSSQDSDETLVKLNVLRSIIKDQTNMIESAIKIKSDKKASD